jgi:thiol:disulfide interchange protein DsbA
MRQARMRTAWLLAVCLSLAACGRQPAGPQAPPTGESASTATTGAGTTSAASPVVAQQKAATGASGEPGTITRINEDGSETVEETAGDNGVRNALLAAVAATTTAAPAAAQTPAAQSQWQEGTSYTRLVPAQPTSVAPGQVEVLEFFWYACPHCYALDPLVEAWRKTKPAYVSFSRVPVMWNENHRQLARLFYTLDSMGKLEALHAAIFKEIHVKNDPLIDTSLDEAATERLQTAFVQSQGIAADAFHKEYHSFAVETALQRADQLTMRYRISGVPTFVVNGKYVADVGTAQGEEHMMPLVSYLAAQEHQR